MQNQGPWGGRACSRSMPASARAISMQVDTPRPSARGSVMWYASHVMPPPRYSARMFAPRACSMHTCAPVVAEVLGRLVRATTQLAMSAGAATPGATPVLYCMFISLPNTPSNTPSKYSCTKSAETAHSEVTNAFFLRANVAGLHMRACHSQKSMEPPFKSELPGLW